MYYPNPNQPDRLAAAAKVTLFVYILQGLAFFLGGLPAVAGIIINYLKRDAVAGTWLESHFRWQIRTFWYGLLWTGLGLLISWLGVGFIVLGIVWVWTLYRVIRGWLNYNDQRPMYGLYYHP